MLLAAQIVQMSRLLDEALPLDASARRHWLDRLGPEHRTLEPALRKTLLALQNSGVDSIGLETLPKIKACSCTCCVLTSSLAPNDCVGPYRLLDRLGAGGMGEVWLARRIDRVSEREVALKVPMRSPLRPDLLQRFVRECDIHSKLEHPNIVAVHDTGVSAQGLPYMAMQWLAGEPLVAWCDRRRLGLRQRIELFLQVLDAVQYAHARRVIHRDIKPANILVTDEGKVWLLDFGLAKRLMNQRDPEAQLTRLYGRALTPDYASPELARGDPLDTTSDVYSLGVVLYELLTGSRPYHIKASASSSQLEQAISIARVRQPSAQLTDEAASVRSTTRQELAHELRGSLDAIVLKALARAPRHRYASVLALAGDLRRHLSGRPVEALLKRRAYRINRLLRRHGARILAAAAMLSAAAMLAAVLAIGLTPVRTPMRVVPDDITNMAAVRDGPVAVVSLLVGLGRQ